MFIKMKKIYLLLLSIFLLNNISAQDFQGKYSLVEGATVPKKNSLEKVKIIEFFSFTCPYCYIFNSSFPELKKKYGNKVKFTHYPLGYAGVNPSKLYFIALEKNKGVEVKDLIFKAFHDSGIRNLNNNNVITALAAEVGLEEDFEKLKSNDLILDQIKFAKFSANNFSIRSTPSFVIEGAVLVRGADIKNLSLVIDSILKK